MAAGSDFDSILHIQLIESSVRSKSTQGKISVLHRQWFCTFDNAHRMAVEAELVSKSKTMWFVFDVLINHETPVTRQA